MKKQVIESEMIECLYCGKKLPANDLKGQMAHMQANHPEIIQKRRREVQRLMDYAEDD